MNKGEEKAESFIKPIQRDCVLGLKNAKSGKRILSLWSRAYEREGDRTGSLQRDSRVIAKNEATEIPS